MLPTQLNLYPGQVQTKFTSYSGVRIIVTTQQAAIIDKRGQIKQLEELIEGHTLTARPDGAWELINGETVKWIATQGRGCGCGGAGHLSQATAEAELR